MQNKKILVSGVIFIVFSLSGTIGALVYPFDLSRDDVTIDVRDMRYACGDCHVDYGVMGIYDSDNEKIEDFDDADTRHLYKFVGWDIVVVYKGNSDFLREYQRGLHHEDEYCSWPVFRLKGQFKRKLLYALIWDGDYYDGLYFDANSGVAVNNEPECKTVPKETILP
jgi:hypothetical protein